MRADIMNSLYVYYKRVPLYTQDEAFSDKIPCSMYVCVCKGAEWTLTDPYCYVVE